ncbi:MAG: hypothetical protein HQL87_18375 [Magnetococcales bacterium]|nr:hypothetical protein [Magnetococcales bacterium]
MALSPSDEMNRYASDFMKREYAAALSKSAIPARLSPITPNDTSVALRLDVGSRSVLLGSDLATGRDQLTGWSSVLASPMALGKKSAVFKVAHHGSKSGWHEGVWSDMLEPRPLALMSPFRLGDQKLPNAADRSRLLAVTNRVFITSHPDKQSPPAGQRMSKIEKVATQETITRRLACGPVGHIRWRAPIHDLTNDGEVELFDGAMQLVDIV